MTIVSRIPSQTGQSQHTDLRAKADKALSILVAIASYGRKQDQFLEQVLAEYRRIAGSYDCKVVVLSDQPKPVDGAEVLAGLPTSNPYSLPFAHRRLFAENVEKFDLFIYAEDDTLLTADHLEAFLGLQRYLKADEILGFIRSETAPAGDQYITSINHFFRWLPETTESRGGELFAQFSNNHSGCFMVTQKQLRRALASGGFLVEPHDEMYGMLESAAADIYTQCGLQRVICVSRIHDFIVPHLPNKYFTTMGIAIDELDRQLRALAQVHMQNGWRGTLHEPQSRAKGFRWSRNLYATPDGNLTNQVPSDARRLLSVGAAAGQIEQALVHRGLEVHAVAMDAVFATALRASGIHAVEGSLTEALENLSVRSFDAILIADVLHLVENPVHWLTKLRPFLSPGGCLIARVDNTGDVWSWIKDLTARQYRPLWPSFPKTGVHAVSARRLRRWCAAAGYSATTITSLMPVDRRQRLGIFGKTPFESFFASEFIVTARQSRGSTA